MVSRALLALSWGQFWTLLGLILAILGPGAAFLGPGCNLSCPKMGPKSPSRAHFGHLGAQNLNKYLPKLLFYKLGAFGG